MQLTTDLRIKTSHYILTGFSMVVALSWNDAVKKTVEMFFPMESEAIYMRIIYSLAMTLLLIIIIKFLPNTDKELPPVVKKELYKND